MTELAELVVRVKADASALERELKKASTTTTREIGLMEKAAGSLKSQLLGLVPAITVASIITFAANATKAADRLNDLSERTGIAATTLSALELPLKQSGSSADEFASSITRMNNAIGEAANNPQAAKNFADIGLAIEDLMAMSPEGQFNAIARALAEIDNQAEFTNKGMAIFGRSFASIAPIIRQTNGEMDEFIKRQQELGLAFTAEELKMVDEFWDAIEGGIKRAEVSLIRFISNFANLRSNMREINSDTELYHAARNSGMTHEQARGLAGRVSSTRPQTVDSITFRAASSASRPAARSAESVTRTQQDFNSHIEDYQRATEEADRATEELANTLKSKLSGSLTDAVFDAENAGDAFRRMMDSIARSIFEKAIAQPFSNAVVDAVGSSGIFGSIGGFFGDLLPSFDVGSYNVPQDMMANIHKGEMIIPARQAEQIRSGGMGGMTIVQNNTFQSGVTRSELQQVLPQVAAAAKNAVFEEINRGGQGAKIVGVR